MVDDHEMTNEMVDGKWDDKLIISLFLSNLHDHLQLHSSYICSSQSPPFSHQQNNNNKNYDQTYHLIIHLILPVFGFSQLSWINSSCSHPPASSDQASFYTPYHTQTLLFSSPDRLNQSLGETSFEHPPNEWSDYRIQKFNKEWSISHIYFTHSTI